jgi:hypothetical protein
VKFTLLLMFYVGTGPTDWQFYSTSTSNYASKAACVDAAQTVWKPFQQLGQKRGVNIVAFCLAEDLTSSSKSERVELKELEKNGAATK